MSSSKESQLINKAAWLNADKATPLEVKNAPYTSPSKGEIVIKSHAIAINPVDRIIQDSGSFMFPWIKFPFVLGTDVAGEVVELGLGVTRFKVGDRVTAHATGMHKDHMSASGGAFQEYVVLLEHMTSPIPDSMSFETASVMPLGLSTAACGLFEKDQLALQYPSVTPQPTGKTILIWGASTSVGCNTVQLAIAAGYEVIATSSPRNFGLLKRLGASQVFDYNSKTVVNDIIEAFADKKTAGAFSIGHLAADRCLDILAKVNGDKSLTMCSFPLPVPMPKRFTFPRMIAYFLTKKLIYYLRAATSGIRYNYMIGDTLVDNGLGKAIYEDFLPEALAKGVFVAAPEPMVIGKGLEFVQEAFAVQKKGVSAKKVVVLL